MAGKRPNNKMNTVDKLKTLGITNDKDILNLAIEDLGKLKDLKLIDVFNIIELRSCIKSKGLIGYILDINNKK